MITKIRRGSAWTACGAVLALSLAGTVVAGPAALAQGRLTPPGIDRRVAEAWGDNHITPGPHPTPAQMPSLTGVVQVSAGATHTLALRDDGTVWAWGNNLFGQLGDGTRMWRSTPVQVKGLSGIIQVSTGGLFSLALRADGTVWAWGDNQFGQLGDGTSQTSQRTPVEVTGLTGVTKISGGGQFSLALRADGTVRAWGRNQAGQLGDGTTTDSPVPVQVIGLSQVRSISAGFDASLATRTKGIAAFQSVWAWGGNAEGQLGDGTFAGHLTPEQVTGVGGPFFASISAGFQFAVVASTDGTVWGWGTNQYGQLGNTAAGSVLNRPALITGKNSGITQLSAGYRHVLALLSGGTVLAWGDNSAGELGDGTTASSAAAVRVLGLTGVTQVSAGAFASVAVYWVPWVSAQSRPA